MKRFHATVTQEIIIDIDESKFDDQFLKEFKECMYNFNTVEEHVEHIAQYFARFHDEDPEGYLNLEEEMFKCSGEVLGVDIEEES